MFLLGLVTEDIVPLYIPPHLQSDNDLAIQRLLADGPPSPRSARTALNAHGANISCKTALAMAKKLAQLAEDRDTATKAQLRHAHDDADVASQAHLETTTYLKESLAKLKERLAELESHLSDSNTGAPFLLAPHCSPHFTDNHGLVPDFYIREDGMRSLTRYVCCVPGTNLAQGTLGGADPRIYTHELQALCYDSSPIYTYFLTLLAYDAPPKSLYSSGPPTGPLEPMDRLMPNPYPN